MTRPKTPAAMTAAEFIIIGQALFGPSWKAPLARALAVNVSTVGRLSRGEKGWLSAEKLADLENRLQALLMARAYDCKKLAGVINDRLAATIKSEGK